MKKFQDKYRIDSARLQNWDYGWNATYFITLCTQNRECYFGEITDGKMQLSEIGKMVHAEWIKTSGIRPDMNLELDEFVVMPNHFHGIIIIGDNKYNCGGHRRDAMHCVSTITTHCVSTKKQPQLEYKNQFGPQYKNLASIMRGFKSTATTLARTKNADFAWQSRFHDHIIRNDGSLHRIAENINSNPENWAEDKFHPPPPY